MNAVEEQILSTLRPFPPTPSNPNVRAADMRVVDSLRELDWLVDVVEEASKQQEAAA